MNIKTLFRNNTPSVHPPRFGVTDPATCEHEWAEREQWHQTMLAEGKTIWVCRHCDTMTNTYSWQKPR